MKKTLTMLAAIICCALIATAFTACGDDDDNASDPGQPKIDDPVPTRLVMSYYYYMTDDMFRYCDVEVSFGDGSGHAESVRLDRDNLDDMLAYKVSLEADHLPAAFTLTRHVTLKDDIADLASFKYYKNGFSYAFALYNAAGQRLSASNVVNAVDQQTSSGIAAADLIATGQLDYTHTYTFDEKGVLTGQ
jgi:hypothetical protein